MLGKIIGARMGQELARRTSNLSTTAGAAIGAVAPTVLRRVGIPALVVLGVGGFAVKKLLDRRKAQESGEKSVEERQKTDNAKKRAAPRQTRPKMPAKPIAGVPQPAMA